MEDYSWLDIISLTLMLLLAIKGMINGLVREVFRLVGIIGGLYLASRFANEAGGFINDNILALHNSSSLYLIGFLALFFTVWLFCLFLGYVFSKFAKVSGLGFVNSLGGFLANGAKVFLIFSALFVAVSNVEFLQSKISKFTQKSFMYPIFVKTGEYIINMDASKLSFLDKNETLGDKLHINSSGVDGDDENKSKSIENTLKNTIVDGAKKEIDLKVDNALDRASSGMKKLADEANKTIKEKTNG